MRVLFVHPAFPGQYRHLAPELAAQRGNDVIALSDAAHLRKGRLPAQWRGVRIIGYDTSGADVFAARSPDAFIQASGERARAVERQATALLASGFEPDVILAHPGWGDATYLKDIFAKARSLLYCEYWFNRSGSDLDFDRGVQLPVDLHGWVSAKNLCFLAALEAGDCGMAPTRWQQRQFPDRFRSRITVIHDGIDSAAILPAATRGAEEVITYAAPSLEPYRGFHVFMRALPDILRLRPHAHVVIAGSDALRYSPALPGGESYRAAMLREIDGKVDLSRIHFVGMLGFGEYVALLRRSSVHVYLTYPFVLSWSMLEAMSAGCIVVGSRTAPVEEVITHADNGLLVDFFSVEEIAATVVRALERQHELSPLREAARRTIVERYDLKRVCLPAQMDLVQRLATGRDPVAM